MLRLGHGSRSRLLGLQDVLYQKSFSPIALRALLLFLALFPHEIPAQCRQRGAVELLGKARSRNSESSTRGACPCLALQGGSIRCRTRGQAALAKQAQNPGHEVHRTRFRDAFGAQRRAQCRTKQSGREDFRPPPELLTREEPDCGESDQKDASGSLCQHSPTIEKAELYPTLY